MFCENKLVCTDLVLPADVGRVHHAVAPVLTLDLVLLFHQEAQFLGAALHVVIQAVEVVAAPLGVVLLEKSHPLVCEHSRARFISFIMVILSYTVLPQRIKLVSNAYMHAL